MTGGAQDLAGLVAAAAVPLPAPEDPDFAARLGAAFDRYADRRVVLLGEASHGTAEFYRARAAITRRLIERHGFTIVAVEADWPDAAAVDRYVRPRPARPRAEGRAEGRQPDGNRPEGDRPEGRGADGNRRDHNRPERDRLNAEAPFRRFPTWMWRNTEVAAFVDWLRAHNAGVADPARRAGFHGLDIYNMRASIAAVLGYLDAVDPAAARVARERYGCLTPWQDAFATYGRAVLTEGYRTCEAEVIAQCRDLLGRALEYAAAEGEGGDDGQDDGQDDGWGEGPGEATGFLDAAQNARLIAAAERYYRIMYYGGAEAWNLRDTHMAETLGHLLDSRGEGTKAVVWAHNSHIGDARHTDMGEVRGEINIGQLARERWGEAVALVGFGTHAGTVAAASDWGGAMEVKTVLPSRPDSYERVCHDACIGAGIGAGVGAAGGRFLLPLDAGREGDGSGNGSGGGDKAGAARRGLMEPRLERFIGVIYRPETELRSHYAKACLPRQFDAWVWFDTTTAVKPIVKPIVTPIPGGEAGKGVPDTYPFGV